MEKFILNQNWHKILNPFYCKINKYYDVFKLYICTKSLGLSARLSHDVDPKESSVGDVVNCWKLNCFCSQNLQIAH